MKAEGLVLTGELRNLREVKVRLDDGSEFDQLQIVIDTMEDWITRVVVPRGKEASVRESLGGALGTTVSVRVTVGNYRKLWYAGPAA